MSNDSPSAAISARTWRQAVGVGSSETDCVRREERVSFAIEESALIVIDPWATHPNDGWSRRMAANLPVLLQAVQLFRGRQRPIFYDSTGLPVHPAILNGAGLTDNFIEWDQNGDGTNVLNNLLVESTLFWAGYAANLCLMSKPCGFRNIMPKDWNRVHLLVRDATIAMESAETLVDQCLWDAACYEVEFYPNGYSCTVAAIAEEFATESPTQSPR